MLTHKNLIANATACQAWIYKAKPAEETILGVLPFFHVLWYDNGFNSLYNASLQNGFITEI